MTIFMFEVAGTIGLVGVGKRGLAVKTRVRETDGDYNQGIGSSGGYQLR